MDCGKDGEKHWANRPLVAVRTGPASIAVGNVLSHAALTKPMATHELDYTLRQFEAFVAASLWRFGHHRPSQCSLAMPCRLAKPASSGANVSCVTPVVSLTAEAIGRPNRLGITTGIDGLNGGGDGRKRSGGSNAGGGR